METGVTVVEIAIDKASAGTRAKNVDDARRTVTGRVTFSVITPSFNQARFLPFTLESIAMQTYANVENIVIDPGSTDGATEIARNQPGIRLINEPDEGQADGINKGFAAATGDVLCWLNSDDVYPNNKVLERVAVVFDANPNVDIVYGAANFVDENGEFLRKGFVNSDVVGLKDSLQYQVGIIQPSVFVRKSMIEKAGALDAAFEFTLDYEFWVRLALAGAEWKYLDEVLSHHRWWGEMKTASRRGESYVEHLRTVKKHFGYAHYKWIERYADYLLTGADGIVTHETGNDADKKRVMGELHRTWNSQFSAQATLRESDSGAAERQATLAHYREHCSYENPVTRWLTGDEEVTSPGEQADGKPLSWQARTGEESVSYTVPGEFHCELDKRWFDQQQAKVREHLESRRAVNQSRTCVIVGNGPSLNGSDWSLLAGYDLIVSNFAYYDKELLALAKYVTVTNRMVAEQGSEQFNELVGVTKVYPAWLSPYFADDTNALFLNATLNPEFSTSVEDEVSWRSTVSFFNMQLAYSLGYERVLLIGFDHSYVQPEGAIEGQPIDQKSDDVNHFRADYFKGKQWQAADVSEMEKVYQLARVAYESAGRTLLNATAGGHLEVFPRISLETAFVDAAQARHQELAARGEKLRVLVLSASEINSQCATGAIKSHYFENIEGCDVLQLYASPAAEISQVQSRNIGADDDERDVHGIALHFRPHVIYFRPSASPAHYFESCIRLIEALRLPVVTHVMDDWVSRHDLKQLQPMYQARMREVLSNSAGRLAISPGMAAAYKERYGRSFFPLANYVNGAPVVAGSSNDGFVIRYCGGLDVAMTRETIAKVALAVEALSADGERVRLDIYTMPWYMEFAESISSENVQVHELASKAEYPKLLASSDLLLIGYNFDEQSIDYVRYSVANKLADYLDAGVPVLVVGPRDIETVSFCESREIGHVCTDNDVNSIVAELAALMLMKPAIRAELVERSHAAYAEFCNSEVSPKMFRAHLTNAAFCRADDVARPAGLASKLKHGYRSQRLQLRRRFPLVRRWI